MLKLYAAPWIGEFGWELFGWQGFLRWFAQQFDKVIVYGRPNHRLLYEDFADYYIDYIPTGKNPNMWMNDDRPIPSPLRNPSDVFLIPQQLTLMPNAPQQNFVELGEKRDDIGYDIVYHARHIDKYGSGYINFPAEKWMELLAHYKDRRIACVGTKDGALYAGGEDLRGVSLECLANIMRNGRVLVGPSSGPMHFGALCSIPTVVWSGYARSASRYLKDWNPFDVPVKMISAEGDPWGNRKEWQPKVEQIIEAIDTI